MPDKKIWYTNIMKKIVLMTMLAGFVASAGLAANISTIDTRELDRQVILYQVEISQFTLGELREIFDEFHESFLDYGTAIDRVNVLANSYYNALQKTPAPIPPDGKKLEEMMTKLLSRMEKYYVYYKKDGRENPFVNYQMHEAMAHVSFEIERLVYQYM